MELLVTGGCGFIGSHLVRRILRETEHRVVNLDALTYAGDTGGLAGVEAEHPGRYRLVPGRVQDPAAVGPLVAGVDAVVHLAAESHVDRSIAGARVFMETNVLGTQTLLDALRRARETDGKNRRLVHVSTDEVYGDLPLGTGDRFTEDSPLRPSSPYAASKAAGDHLVAAAVRTHGLDAVVARPGNNLGPWQHPEKLIPRFVTRLMGGERVPLYGDGANVRDWIHAGDTAEALLLLLERGRPGGVYNVGAGNQRSNLGLTRALLRLFGAGEEKIERVADRPGHDRRYAVDATRLREELGWRPTRSAWPEALEQTVAWYRANEAWWRPLVERG